MHFVQFFDKKACVDCIKASLQTFGGQVHLGVFISCCKFYNILLNAKTVWHFYSYNSIKTFIQGGNATMRLGPSLHMLAAAQAGVLTLVLTNPIWVVKTRLCLQVETQTSINENAKQYRGMLDALIKIYKSEGVRGLYRVSL